MEAPLAVRRVEDGRVGCPCGAAGCLADEDLVLHLNPLTAAAYLRGRLSLLTARSMGEADPTVLRLLNAQIQHLKALDTHKKQVRVRAPC
jgi:hypothetical protein